MQPQINYYCDRTFGKRGDLQKSNNALLKTGDKIHVGGKLFVKLAGSPIGAYDVLIAVTAVINNHIMVTSLDVLQKCISLVASGICKIQQSSAK